MNNRNNGKKKRVHDTIVESLGQSIVSGVYAPGMVLSNEATMGESFNASRTATREAFKTLSSKGLIASRPKIGTVVRQRKNWSLLDPKVLEWCVLDPRQFNRTMTEIYEVRTAFEPFAAALAARNRQPEDLLSMRRALRGMAHYVGSTDRTECDLNFHKAILHATGNSMFEAVGNLISVGLKHLFQAGFEATSEEDERWLCSHRDVANAIEDSDEKRASAAMFRLLTEAQSVHSKREN